jgi:HPt (histidine-containing phosphotransfer) domain-containing protein
MVENIEANAIADISEIVKKYPEFVNLRTLDIHIFQDLRQSIGDDLVFSDLVTIYLSSAENLLAEIQLAFVNQDVSKFCLASHSLKSTSASIGAMRLSYVSKYFEKVSKTGDLPVTSQLLNLLTEEYDKVIKAIQISVIEFMAE